MLMMWIKRFVPFVAALALGLFIASFFVSFGMPKFRKFERRHNYTRDNYTRDCKYNHKTERRKMQALEAEIETLRRERDFERTRNETRLEELSVLEPIPPVAPIAPRQRR